MEQMEKLRYERAKEYVGELRAVYVHTGIYLMVMASLAVLNLMTTGFPWMIFPAMGWGLGLLSTGPR